MEWCAWPQADETIVGRHPGLGLTASCAVSEAIGLYEGTPPQAAVVHVEPVTH